MIGKFFKDEDTKRNYGVFRFLVIMFCIKCYAKFMFTLTKYPPFSSFWKYRFFHYQNRDISLARERINKPVSDLVGEFDVRMVDRDEYFLTLIGSFYNLGKKVDIKKRYGQIAEKMEKEDFYINELENGNIKILLAIK